MASAFDLGRKKGKGSAFNLGSKPTVTTRDLFRHTPTPLDAPLSPSAAGVKGRTKAHPRDPLASAPMRPDQTWQNLPRFAENAGKSVGRAVRGAAYLGGAVGRELHHLLPGGPPPYAKKVLQNPRKEAQAFLDNVLLPVGRQYRDNYGSLDAFGNHFYEDPFSVITDALSVGTLGATSAGKAATLNAGGKAKALARVLEKEGATAAQVTGTANKAINAAKLAKRLNGGAAAVSEAANAADPATVAARLGKGQVKKAVDAARSRAQMAKTLADDAAGRAIHPHFQALNTDSRKRVLDYVEGRLPGDEPLTKAEQTAVRLIRKRDQEGAGRTGLTPEQLERRRYLPATMARTGKDAPHVTAAEIAETKRLYPHVRSKTKAQPGQSPLPPEERGVGYLHHAPKDAARPADLMQPGKGKAQGLPDTPGYLQRFEGAKGMETDPETMLLSRAYAENAHTANRRYAEDLKALAKALPEGLAPSPGFVPFDPDGFARKGLAATPEDLFPQAGGNYQIPVTAKERLLAHTKANDFGKAQPLADVWDAATGTWKAAVLPLRPAWTVANMSGDVLRDLIASKMGLARGVSRLMNPEWRRDVPDSIHLGGFATPPPRSSRLPGALGDTLTDFWTGPAGGALTKPLRWLEGVNQGLEGVRRSALYLDSLPGSARPGAVRPEDAAAALARVDDAHGNYDTLLGPFEQKWVRRAVPFYPFTKAIARFYGLAPTRYPVPFKAYDTAGKTADAINREMWEGVGYEREDLPPWLRLGWPEGPAGHKTTVTRGIASNPFNPLYDVIEAGPLAYGRRQLSPWIRLPVDRLTGTDTLTGEAPKTPTSTLDALGSLFPQYQLATTPEAKRKQALTRYLFGPTATDYDVEGIAGHYGDTGR